MAAGQLFRMGTAGRIESTAPKMLREIFSQVDILPSDILVDIGCGDGDVIQYWLDLGLNNKIIGKELDLACYFNTKSRFLDRLNVRIVRGDAAREPPIGTLYYLFNPFDMDGMIAFEKAVPRNARIIYFNPKQLKAFSQWKFKEIYQPHPHAVLISAA